MAQSHQERRSREQLGPWVSGGLLSDLNLFKELLCISSSALMDCPESFSHTTYKGNYSWPPTSPATKAEVSCKKNPLQSARRSWWVMRSSHFGSCMGNRRERQALCGGKPDGSLSWHTAVPCQGRCKVHRASPAWAAGKGSVASFPSPAASASQHSRKLTFCLSREGKQMHCSILCHPFMALCPPAPPDAFQIALAFGPCSCSAKWVLSQIWLASQFSKLG